jgi:membrane associated rhomboid family serine protease
VLLEYGAAQDILVKNGQVHRLLIASFLHMNLLHVVMNLVCFMFLLSRLEKTFEVKVLGVILLAAAVSGNDLILLV